MILGIDHGYYAIKTRNCSFPAGITPFGDREPYTRQNVLTFGGCFFVCGSGRQPIQRDKTANDNYYLLTLAAIAQELQARGAPRESSVTIAAGWPLTSYKHKHNTNILVVGGSGAGKTRTYAVPNVLEAARAGPDGKGCSLVITDPKAEILRKTGAYLTRQGYEVRVFDLINPSASFCYNPFCYVQDDKDVLQLITNLIQNITRAAKSEYMPQLQIVDDELFTKANEMMDSRCKTAAEQRNAARKSGNPTLLAGIVVCVHCGAKMSAFLHKDRYKLADGTIRENVQAKYNCYQRGQHLRPCDGQSLYLAERVDGIVLDLVDQMFQQIKREPYDRSIEQRIRQQDAELNRKKVAAEKKIQAAQHKQQRYEEEIVRCLDGKSAFSESTLARLIQQAEAEVQQAKNEYTALLKDNSSRTTVQQIRKYYDEFLGWANEFDLASIPRKRTILAQLLERVEVGKGYRVRIVVKGSYRQFLAGEGEAKEDFLEGA